MRKAVIISFSGRKNGNCRHIAEIIKKHKEETENTSIAAFSELHVSPCGECDYECFRDTNCPHHDDGLYELYELVCSCDIVYYVVPNYCDYPCSDFFVFNERSQCYFQKHPEGYPSYFKIRKKFIVISNTNIENFKKAFSIQVEEGTEPEILFLQAKSFGKVSLDGDLMTSVQARKQVIDFIVC